MGYYMYQDSADFFIPAKNKNAVIKAIKQISDSNKNKIGDLFLEWGWEIDEDENSNIIDIRFMGEKLVDDKLLFDTICPFVRCGSYIQMRGEDGSMWRWVFDGNIICKEIYPEIKW